MPSNTLKSNQACLLPPVTRKHLHWKMNCVCRILNTAQSHKDWKLHRRFCNRQYSIRRHFSHVQHFQSKCFALNISVSEQSNPTHQELHHIILQKCLGEEECCGAGWLSSWLTWSHSQGVMNFCPTAAPLLAAREDLGDTKQEVLNKWKLWMFISRHSSSPKTSEGSRDPGPGPWHKAVPTWKSRVATWGPFNASMWVRWRPDCGGLHHPLAGSLHPFSQSSRSLAWSRYPCAKWWHWTVLL